jgi:hypothetical protein
MIMNYYLVKSKLNYIQKLVSAETCFHAIQKVIYTTDFLGHKTTDFITIKI